MWSPGRICNLVELWREGLTASQIAALLNVSRNAVCGKIRRMGMSDRGSPIKRYSGNGPTPESRRFPDLRPATCQYPLGELMDSPEWFCGKPTGNAHKPYCDHHHSVSWIKPTKGQQKSIEWHLTRERRTA